MKNIILLAVQGAGKGTFAKLLKEKYGYIHISTGDILRERAQVNDKLGKEIKNLIDNGIFAPDEVVYQAIEYKITQPECKKGYILDGFPRNIEQAREYDKILEKLGKKIGVVINLVIPKEVLKQRIVGRRICESCGAIYNIYDEALKPKVDNHCDKCSGVLKQREDDNEDAMNKRVKTYFEVTAPVIDYYKQKGVLKVVDSNRKIEETLKEIIEILESVDVDN